jgi:NhaA family Na+:H+ antiporter
MEHSLHFWVQFVIMPIFALANAGVALSLGGVGGETGMVTLGVVAGLVLGKPIGLLGASWLAIRGGIAALPEGVQWRHMAGASCLGGIGFTMSLFVGTLAFGESDLLAAAKLGILAASVVAGSLGYFLLRRGPAANAQG